MPAINTNYIHHVTREQYDDAMQFILVGRVPQGMSRPAQSRFRRRWKDAKVANNTHGQRRIYVHEKEVIAKDEINDVLAKLYDDPGSGNLGRDKFYARVNSLYVGISRNDVENFIKQDETYQLHRPVRVTSCKVTKPLAVPSSPLKHWQMDLIDMGASGKHDNLGYQYVLTVIDIFSKYAWAKPLKTKGAREVANALQSILEKERPAVLQSDNGSEFRSKSMRRLLERHGVKQIFGTPYHPQSQGCVERFNGTLKRMMHAHMTRYSTQIWADMMQSFLDNYNTVVHSSTGFVPKTLHETDDEEMWQRAKEKLERRNDKWLSKATAGGSKSKKTVEIGSMVRLGQHAVLDDPQKQQTFAKSYTPNWSQEVYKVVAIHGQQSSKQRSMYVVQEEGTQHAKRIKVNYCQLQLLDKHGQIRKADPKDRPHAQGFHYRDEQRRQARSSRTSQSSTSQAPLATNRQPRQRRPYRPFGDDFM